MKKIFSLIISVVMAFSLLLGMGVTASAANNSGKAYQTAPYYLEEVDGNYYGFIWVSETDELALYVSEKTANIAVLVKNTGEIWSSLVTEPVMNEVGISAGNKNRFTSILYIEQVERSVVAYSTESVDSMETLMGVDGYSAEGLDRKIGDYTEIDYSSVHNGVRITVNFSYRSSLVAVDISLDDETETLQLYVNSDLLTSDTELNKILVGISLLPSFGAAKDSDDGYVFIPDGSGTISKFSSAHTDFEVARSLLYMAPSLTSVGKMTENEIAGTMPLLYPVFGIKRNDSGIFAIITEGAEQAGVKFYPSGIGRVNISRIHSIYYIEDAYDAGKNGEGFGGAWNGGESYADIASFRVQYHFLNKEDANYSGMARTYRKYLLENGKLNDAIADGDEMPLALTLYMNTIEERALDTKTIVMTTFSQAKEIMETFKNKGIADMLINITDWQVGGDETDKITSIPNDIGGKNGLKDLAEYTKENGYDLFMEVNMIAAKKSATKFDFTRDSAKTLDGLPIFDKLYLIAPPVIQSRYEDIYQPYFEDTGISGFNLQRMAYYFYYYNYDGVRYYRDDAVTHFSEIMSQMKKDNDKLAVWYGNEYSLAYADWIYDLPSTDTGYANTTRSVPFAQMVLHGYIPYTSIAGNLFYNEDQQTLKWIEYGYIPFYKLTYSPTNNLVNTELKDLFSAEFVNWIDDISSKYAMMKSEFGHLYSQIIYSHEELAKDVYKIVYENGSEIYVNYSKIDAYSFKANGQKYSVEPMSYIIIEG